MVDGPGAGGSYFDIDTPELALRSLFTKYDVDGNNTLSCDELQVLLKDDLGMTAEQAETYAYLLDKDGSKRISYQEFKDWLHSGERFKSINDKSRYFLLRKAVELFKGYDRNSSGALERAEFETLMLQCGGKRENIDLALSELDSDGNGVISFQEFLRWLNWFPADQW